jgi:hypothetical protein
MGRLEILERSREEGVFIRSGDLLLHCLHNRHTYSLNGEFPHFKDAFSLYRKTTGSELCHRE